MNPAMNVLNPRAKAPPARGQRAALLVDDDTFQIELLSAILRNLGLTDITAVQGGAPALDKLTRTGAHFDLILLDLHMPGMDGFQFMEALGKTDFAGDLIIVSGQNEEVMRAATLVARLRRFTLLGSVSKPVGQQALAALI
jgi:CheY-like chemotaxis protein